MQRQAAAVFEGERIICRRIGERRHALDPREALQDSPLVQQPGSRDWSSRLLVDDHPAEVGNIAAIHQAAVALMDDRARRRRRAGQPRELRAGPSWPRARAAQPDRFDLPAVTPMQHLVSVLTESRTGQCDGHAYESLQKRLTDGLPC